MKAILFDIDGVLYEGERVVAGAPEVIAWCRSEHIPHIFVTNTTSRPRTAIADKLARLDIQASAEEILTPPVAAVEWLQQNVTGPVALFVPEATKAEFAALDLLDETSEAGAAAVVVGDLGERWDFETLNRAFRLLMAAGDVRLLALGMTRYWRASDGLRLDTAPFVTALQHAAGREPVVLGKPSAAFFAAALSRLDARAEETAMVGDDIRTDVAGARAAGLAGVLVKTGKFRPQDLDRGIATDAVLESVAELPDWWRAHAR